MIPQELPEAAWCSRCETWRPLAAFNKDRSREWGVDVYCRACRSLANYAARVRKIGRIPRKYGDKPRPDPSKRLKAEKLNPCKPRKKRERCDWCGERPKTHERMTLIDGSPVCPDCVPRVAAGERPQDREQN